MALRGDRFEGVTDIKHFMNEVAERGGIATLSTAGSGAALDQSANLVSYTAANSGAKPVGILLNDMVNKDLTRTHINFHKNEVQKGGKVTLLKRGYVDTDYIVPGQSPAGGDEAFVGPSGYLSNVQDGGAFPVGEFETSKDEDGYATVHVNLPYGGRPSLA